jgi:arsenite methyltransferase
MAEVSDGERIREAVKERYGRAARGIVEGRPERGPCGCCTTGCCDQDAAWGAALYEPRVRAEAPEAAFLASLGCGNPTAVAELREGETVLDLGSGAGLDVVLSAKRVGPAGTAYGLDMTEEMLALARTNASRAGVSNALFLQGHMEATPLPDESVDVVISNCAVNLSPRKDWVFAQAFRVLRPGGRLALTDVVADVPRAPDLELDPDAWASCLAGALTREEYWKGLLDAGFEDVSVEDSHRVAEGFASAVIRARKPPSTGPERAPSGTG